MQWIRLITVNSLHKEARSKATKAEEEVADLMKKSTELEMELGKATEDLVSTTHKLEEKEKSLLC